MKLKEYLKENNITHKELIKIIELKNDITISQGAIAKYVIGQRIPRKVEMQAIYRATDFNVSANDFYDIEATQEEKPIACKDKNSILKTELAAKLEELNELFLKGLLDKDVYKEIQRELLKELVLS